ncbi:peptidylprolyl isomerase [Bosea sp. (in: a-proteobacteria)]|uniref:peptidylprolyl isomerase n=1 Tax=Bosea sp. (in: a-proteobacteria) TaxID=1871050 RepID=UPI0026210EFB|nr:peptidylprolyl isomerase [Bosea sp. (in: a-proteobacteria)]MCO5091187.1 peptidylprolyl isomerase [Bosea sp. (in: a-proteobacteria)]
MSSCQAKPAAPAPKAPITVNGAVISRAMIAREVQNHPAPSPAAAWKAAALALVIREALRQEVQRLAIEAEPLSDGAGRRETEDEARMRALVEREVSVPEPTEAECRRYYERNARRFGTPDLYEASHILFAARRDDVEGYERARQQAAAAIAELAAAPGRFAELARLHSGCPSAEIGGNLGQIGPGQTTPLFEKALSAMTPGSISREPVETPYGCHVIRLDRAIAGRLMPFELVQERIAAYLGAAVRQRAQAQYVARLIGAARIEGIDVPSPGEFNVH